MNALSWVGVVLMAFGVFWGFMIWVSETWFGKGAAASRGIPAQPRAANPIAEILKAVAAVFKAAAELLKLHYGAPGLTIVTGLIVLIIGQVKS